MNDVLAQSINQSIMVFSTEVKHTCPQWLFTRMGSATFFSFVSVFDWLIASLTFAVISDHEVKPHCGAFSRRINTVCL